MVCTAETLASIEYAFEIRVTLEYVSQLFCVLVVGFYCVLF